MRLIVPCPAKLNLFLAVGPRDRRGYHPIRSVFQAVSLFDTLEIEPGHGSHRVEFDVEGIPERNTVTRTLSLLAEVIDLPPLTVRVRKRIPLESGLGGGSSDAAGVIRAARTISQLPIPEAELLGLAQTIGADVPFFLTGGRARAEGYGERLTPLPDPQSEWYAIARPEVGCATGEAYARLDEIDYVWRDYGPALYNDFERVAPCESLELIERLNGLGALESALSGSGSAVFGRFAGETRAKEARDALTREGTRAWVVRSLTRAESLSEWIPVPDV